MIKRCVNCLAHVILDVNMFTLKLIICHTNRHIKVRYAKWHFRSLSMSTLNRQLVIWWHLYGARYMLALSCRCRQKTTPSYIMPCDFTGPYWVYCIIVLDPQTNEWTESFVSKVLVQNLPMNGNALRIAGESTIRNWRMPLVKGQWWGLLMISCCKVKRAVHDLRPRDADRTSR